MFRRKARDNAFDEEDGSLSKSKNKLKHTGHQSNPRSAVSINLLVALSAFLLALLLVRQDSWVSCSPGKEIGPQLKQAVASTSEAVSLGPPQLKQAVASISEAVSLGPLTAADLPPDEKFIKSTQYTDMLEYVRERNDIEGLRNSFEEKGYIVFKPEIPDDVLEGAKKFTEDVYNTCIVNLEPPDKCRSMHQDKFMEVEAVRELAQNYHIRAMLAVLNGYNPYPLQTLNYPCTSLARTHSDYIHFAAHPLPLMNAAWVALIDVQPDAGPVFYHEGSHKLPFYNMQDFGLHPRGEGPYNYAKYQNFMTEAMSLHGRYYEAVIPKGHCLIWSANLVHGGPPAKVDKKPRFSQVTHYFFHGSNYNWVPVASDLHKRQVEYYSPESVLEMWDEKIPLAKRKSLSKFVGGDCEKFTKGRDGVISPCEMQSRPPLVMSKLYEYIQQDGEVVM